MSYLAEPTSREKVRPLLLLTVLLMTGGGGGGIATSALIFYLMKGTRGVDDVAYALGGGIGCLVTGIVLMSWRIKGPTWLWSPAVALLLGFGTTFVTLGFFWWMQRSIFVYRRYPDLNYFLGEVGGYSGPGLGLLTCGIVMVLSSVSWLDNGHVASSEISQNPFLMLVSQPQRQTPRVLLQLSLSLILGAGAGLLNGAIIYILLLGRKGPTSDLAGFVASGFGCIFTGVAFLLFCARTGRVSWLYPMGVVLFLLTGMGLCGTGILRWLA